MKQRVIKVIKITLLLMFVFISYCFINKKTGIYIPCIFYKITGYRCPGCGITHMLFNLLNFKIADAFSDNYLAFIYLPFIIGYYIYEIYLYVWNKKDKVFIKIPDYVWKILIVITITYGY